MSAEVLAEREAAARYAERQCGEAATLAGKGRISDEEGELLAARLRAFASGIRAGLHVESEPSGGGPAGANGPRLHVECAPQGGEPGESHESDR